MAVTSSREMDPQGDPAEGPAPGLSVWGVIRTHKSSQASVEAGLPALATTGARGWGRRGAASLGVQTHPREPCADEETEARGRLAWQWTMVTFRGSITPFTGRWVENGRSYAADHGDDGTNGARPKHSRGALSRVTWPRLF